VAGSLQGQAAVEPNLCSIKSAVSLLAAAFALAGGACSTGGAASSPAPAAPGPASWQGPLVDRMNRQAVGPLTPALRTLAGGSPVVYVTRVPPRGSADEPAYEVAVFDDGTVVYEGHRCVEVGGVTLTRLPADELTRLRDLLPALCAALDAPNDDELCADAATVHVLCASGERMRVGTDHCRATDEARARRVDALVSALDERVELSARLGAPAHRQACSPGARDLAPHELWRTIRADLAYPASP
jgi:hypothetical protein